MAKTNRFLSFLAAAGIYFAAGCAVLFPSLTRADGPSTAASAAPVETANFSVDPKILAAADEAILEPTGDDQTPALLAAVEQHPYHQEVVRRLKLAGDAGDTARKYKVDGAYTPERDKLQQSIVDRLLNPAAKAAAGQKPIAIVAVGLPGAGKTTVISPWPKKLNVTCSVANSDDIQSQLPEYEGWNADLLHNEAGDVLRQMLLPRAIAERHNLVVDVTGREPTKTIAIADRLAEAGYRIYLIYAHLPPGKAAYRVWHRFRGGAFQKHAGDPDSGRYVSPRFVATGFGNKPAETYAALKKHPATVHWIAVDTSGGHGQPGRIEEEGPATDLPPAGK